MGANGVNVSMQDHATRRTFIATIGAAGAASLAGCSTIFGPDNGGSGNGNGSPGNGGNGGGGGGGGGGTTDGNGGNNGSKNVIENFEGDVGKRWQIDYGQYSTSNDSQGGSKSVVLTPQSPEKARRNFPFARITRYFGGDNSKPLDLSNKDLSMAVKVKKPKDAKITVKLLAPSNSISLQSNRYIPLEMDGWVRYDLGYTGVSGKPTMDKILGMQIIIDSRGFTTSTKKPFQVAIDEISTVPKPKKGKVIFQFDDGTASTHSTVFPILKKKGFPGATAVIPDAVGNGDRMSRKELLELSNDGWDVMAHPRTGTPLPKLPKEEQERKVQRTYQALSALGFKNGARHFVAPYSRVNSTTLDIVKKYHKTCFLFGGAPNNGKQPSNPYFLSRVQGGAVRGTKHMVDMAAQFNQLVVIEYHRVGKGANKLPKSSLKSVVDYVEKKNVDVIAPSQLIDGK